MDKTKKTNLALKKEKVAEIARKLKLAKTVVFADYHGLSASQISELREKIRQAGGELIVVKNTLTKRALQISNFKFQISNFTGPTATLLSYEDEVAPIKATAESAKTLGVPKFKFGFFGRDFLDAQDVENLAQILPKEMLQQKIVGSLSSPLYGVVGVLSANIRNLISVLNQRVVQG